MSRIEFKNKRISTATNVWTVDGYAEGGLIVLTEIHGDITDLDGLHDALDEMVAGNPHYARAGCKPS